MAKQSGLHQIRGKVGEHSYYRQTGVSSGLIRSINQGMSARVKNDEAYANTRLNNQEFAFAAEIAGRLGTFVQPKFRPMVLPFSQAKMAKTILNLIRTTSSAAWGWRGIGSVEFGQILQSLNDTAKYPFENLVSQVILSATTESLSKENWEVNIDFQSGASDLLTSIGAQGVFIKAMAINVISKDPNRTTLTKGYMNTRVMLSTTETISGVYSGTIIDLEGVSTPSVSTGESYSRVVCVLVMPYRELDDVKNILQEYCSFKAFPVSEP